MCIYMYIHGHITYIHHHFLPLGLFHYISSTLMMEGFGGEGGLLPEPNRKEGEGRGSRGSKSGVNRKEHSKREKKEEERRKGVKISFGVLEGYKFYNSMDVANFHFFLSFSLFLSLSLFPFSTIFILCLF